MKRNHVNIRVIYADTDAMGIVYHTNYIKWFEIGRTELLRSVGIVYAKMEAAGYNLPLTEVYCNYLFPAKYDQVIIIDTELEYLKRASMKFLYTIWDEEKEKALVEGYTIHACTNKIGKIVRIPSFILDKVNEQTQIEF